MSSNELTHLDTNIFQELSSLSYLDLHSNRFEALDRKCFEQLNESTIEVILLYENKIENNNKFKSIAKDEADGFVDGIESVSDFKQFLDQFQSIRKNDTNV